MRRQDDSRTLIAICVALLVCFYVTGIAHQNVTTKVSGEKAPVAVQITGSDFIVSRINSCRYSDDFFTFGTGNNGLYVDWDDGTDVFQGLQNGQSCADAQRNHTFDVPGIYNVRISTLRAGNDKCADCITTESVTSKTFVVNGATPQDSLNLENVSSQEIAYHGGLYVSWNASAASRSTIIVEAVDDKGAVITKSEEMTWSRLGSRKVWFTMQGKEYETAVGRGDTSVRIRIRMLRGNKVIREVFSEPVLMSR
ncbi:hypothetical protein [Rhizobium sp. BK176]|uniref:hypothetical protein n=1 Tax=Rhizobium sp. BK176 TaxID=2587071 RepID=UPI002167FF61|nr:hypothetical protein [Rhizobium sp. BK176]MCS4089945.1 hypothetical protein [Rhizobium sp. BK176]